MKLLYLTSLTIFIFSCEERVENVFSPINSFEMVVNDEYWQPSLINQNPCLSTFNCTYSELNELPFYTITAYKDSLSRTGFMSKYTFEIQLMDVKSVGIYPLKDTIGDFNSYVAFKVGDALYLNKPNSISKVEVEELYSMQESTIVGLKGTFSGTLFNQLDLEDSVVIKNCKFQFKRLNRYDFYHCID